MSKSLQITFDAIGVVSGKRPYITAFFPTLPATALLYPQPVQEDLYIGNWEGVHNIYQAYTKWTWVLSDTTPDEFFVNLVCEVGDASSREEYLAGSLFVYFMPCSNSYRTAIAPNGCTFPLARRELSVGLMVGDSSWKDSYLPRILMTKGVELPGDKASNAFKVIRRAC